MLRAENTKSRRQRVLPLGKGMLGVLEVSLPKTVRAADEGQLRQRGHHDTRVGVGPCTASTVSSKLQATVQGPVLRSSRVSVVEATEVRNRDDVAAAVLDEAWRRRIAIKS